MESFPSQVVNSYLEKKDIDVDDRLFNFKKSIKILSDVDNILHTIMDN